MLGNQPWVVNYCICVIWLIRGLWKSWKSESGEIAWFRPCTGRHGADSLLGNREAKDAGRETWYLSWALDSTPQERSQVCLDSPISPPRPIAQTYFMSLPSFKMKTIRVKPSKSEEPTLKPIFVDTPSSMLQVTRPMFLV